MSINITALLEKAIYEATSNQDDAYFITLQDRNNKQNWLQLTGDSINTYYPYAEKPEQKLKELELPTYPDMEVSLWEKELFLTLTHNAGPLDKIEAFVEAYLTKVMDYNKNSSDWEVSYE